MAVDVGSPKWRGRRQSESPTIGGERAGPFQVCPKFYLFLGQWTSANALSKCAPLNQPMLCAKHLTSSGHGRRQSDRTEKHRPGPLTIPWDSSPIAYMSQTRPLSYMLTLTPLAPPQCRHNKWQSHWGLMVLGDEYTSTRLYRSPKWRLKWRLEYLCQVVTCEVGCW